MKLHMMHCSQQERGDQRSKASLFSVHSRELAHLVLDLSPGPGSPMGSRESSEGEEEEEKEGERGLPHMYAIPCHTAGERKISPKCLNIFNSLKPEE